MTLLLSMGAVGRAADTPPTEASKRLHQLFADEWERQMRESPTWASELGDRRYNDLWPDQSLAAIEKSQAATVAALTVAKSIDAGALGDADRMNLRLFERGLETAIEMYPHRWHVVPMDHRSGIQTDDSHADQLRFETLKDFQDWAARLERFGEHMDQTIALMRLGIAEGRVHAKVIMQRVPRQIAAQVVDDPTKSLFYEPFARMPESIAAADREEVSQRARKAITDVVVPAYQRLGEFIEKQYLPACTEKVGVWQWPEGRELYASRARMFTTTDMTPDEIHAVGLSEVARIRAEMQKVMDQVGFKGTYDAFFKQLRTEKRFYYDKPEDLLAGYRALSKRIDPTLVKLFRTMPRMPYGVEPVPANMAPDSTTAYYQGPAADGSRAGAYYVNLYRPETRPKWEMTALSLHEAVPGHHLQIALAMEQGELPKFRRYGGYTAYVEGWALYCETIGDELGVYDDPYAKFGQLTYEMWRAVRLVVDTGMHYKGWTRQQAIDFFKANAPKSELDITNEVDRYIAWPGQALAYKIGQMKITQLRKQATEELGEHFDVRAFHDVVLLGGAVPLDILEQNVEGWIARVKAGQ